MHLVVVRGRVIGQGARHGVLPFGIGHAGGAPGQRAVHGQGNFLGPLL